MRKVIVNEFITLDGTAQAPGGPDEDTSGGFQHGGWHMQHGAGSGMVKVIGEAGGFRSAGARTSSSPATGQTPRPRRTSPASITR